MRTCFTPLNIILKIPLKLVIKIQPQMSNIKKQHAVIY